MAIQQYLLILLGLPILADAIYGGNATGPHEFPFMAYVESPRCGGVIINNYYVLTAAHCIGDAETWFHDRINRFGSTKISVKVGHHDIESPHAITINVDSVSIHPGYKKERISHDIALLKLSKKLEFNDAVQPIDLPKQEDVIHDMDDLEIAGWGKTADPADYWMKETLPHHYPNTLLKLEQS